MFSLPAKVTFPETVPALATDNVIVVPEIPITKALLPMPVPRTDMPVEIFVELLTVMVLAPLDPLPVLVTTELVVLFEEVRPK